MSLSTDTSLRLKILEQSVRYRLSSACLYIEDTDTALSSQFFASALCDDCLIIKPLGHPLSFLGGDNLPKIPLSGDPEYPVPLKHLDFYDRNADIGSVFTFTRSGYSEKSFGSRTLLLEMMARYGDCDEHLLDIRGRILTVCAADPMSAAECAIRLISLLPRLKKIHAFSAKVGNITADYFSRNNTHLTR